MRTSPLLITAAAGTFLLLAASTGTALATPADPTGGAAEPGFVSVSPSSAAPGASVRISGTCPTAADGAGDPSVQSVRSEAFAGPESFSKTDPTAFDGTATIASGAPAGSYTVTLTCNNGTASGAVTVSGGSTPAPEPSGNGSNGGSNGTGTGVLPAPEPGTGGQPRANAAEGGGDGESGAVDEESDSSTPWGWITAGGIVVVGAAAGGTYALTRRRDTGAGTPTTRTRG